jgi:DNA-binding NarL/FixJ family response regulator
VNDRLASKLLHRLIEQPDGSTALSALSDLELKVVPLIGQGRGRRQIAEALHLKREDRGAIGIGLTGS